MSINMQLKLNLLMLLLILATCISCVSFNEHFISPGRVKKGQLANHNVAFGYLSTKISGISNPKYEVIGHGAGSWRYYPMGINKSGIVYGNGFRNKKDAAHSIVSLIDESIKIDPEMSIELDAQYPPDSHDIRKKHPKDGAYVLHDIPKWDDPSTAKERAIEYLHLNTLQNAMNHFTAKEYYKKSKVYIEIKVTKECYGLLHPQSDCIRDCRKLAGELERYAANYTRSSDENWLSVSSFSPVALEVFRNSLPDQLKDKFDYVLILGFTGGAVREHFAQKKGFVPRFTRDIADFVSHTEWLTVVWFSVQGIPKFKVPFNNIIYTRKIDHPDWKDLEFSFSTYQYCPKLMSKKILVKEKDSMLNGMIRSFMLDIDTEDNN